jgi:hypothetical protein
MLIECKGWTSNVYASSMLCINPENIYISTQTAIRRMYIVNEALFQETSP